MKLEDIINNNLVIDSNTLETDEELVEQIQTQLSNLLLYPSPRIDGIYGKRTEQALVEFCNALRLNNMATEKFGKTFAEKLLNAKELPQSKFLNDADYERAAESLGVEVAAIRAVVEVETKGRGFLDDDRPQILFERHIFWRRSQVRDRVQQIRLDLCNPSPGGYLGGTKEWDRLNDAIKFDQIAALESASWGLGQVMGFNYEIAGYSDVETFVEAMHQSESKQLEAMMNYIKKTNLDLALRHHDWAAFARGYNGPSHVRVYAPKLAKAYKRHARGEVSGDRAIATNVTNATSEVVKTNGSAKVTPSVQEIQATSTTATQTISTTATHLQIETPQVTLRVAPAEAPNSDQSPIKLLDTYKHWTGESHQVEAIAYLDKTISDTIRAEVTRLWRSQQAVQLDKQAEPKCVFQMDLPESSQRSLLTGTLDLEGTQEPHQFTCTSGQPRHQYRGSTNIKGRGPLPSCEELNISNYWIFTEELHRPHTKGIEGYAFWIKPDPINIRGVQRGEFMVHNDTNREVSPGSSGCIVFLYNKGWEIFRDCMREFRQRNIDKVPLIVKYS